jgi:hypothetical protein
LILGQIARLIVIVIQNIFVGLVKDTFTATLVGPSRRLLANGLLLTLRLNRFLKLPWKVRAKLKSSFEIKTVGQQSCIW